VNEAEVLQQSRAGGDTADYFSTRNRQIEQRNYLTFDGVHRHVHTLLESLLEDWDLSVVTHRGERENLLWQLEQLQIAPYFQEIISGRAEKALMIKESAYPVATEDWIIGDTEIDIRAAKALGMGAIGVTWGIREEAVLAAEKPAHMAGDIQTLRRLLSAVI
jgi:phosphoglycolate phosphatase-like HAD superfamily hydrolase